VVRVVLVLTTDLQTAERLKRPRVWWCVTGELTFLPIHAACMSQGGILKSAADYLVSSYIPTLSALTKSRANWTPVPRSDVTGILAACKNSPAQAPLYNVEREIDVAAACFTQSFAQVSHSSSPNTSSQLLRKQLTDTSAHILHLACHGEQAEKPLKSAFLLSDGRFCIEDLMAIRLPHAVLAFLSACQTAKGSEHLPDQAVHLAASMLFCGFRSVVGTMW
jgi:CHAT domain-containing protein